MASLDAIPLSSLSSGQHGLRKRQGRKIAKIVEIVNMPRTIFHIDMNSYFCSVAAQANPFLRGKAFGVGGKPGTRSIIAAVSREAKARGVKGIMNAHEALKICPELEIIHGDSGMYEEITNRFLRIFRRYTEEVEVFSIDEAFLDMTGWTRGALDIAECIKSDMRRELGPAITCSIGIAENKLLAKLGSDLKKPDGITEVRDITPIWPTLPVGYLCGIGPRLAMRLLGAFGVRTAAELATIPLHALVDVFGPVAGYDLYLKGRGEDPRPVVSTVEAAKSYSHSYTLPRDSTDQHLLRKTLFLLTEKVCRRMRNDAACGKTIFVYVRYHDFSGQGTQTKIGTPSNDGLILFRHAWRLVHPLILNRPVRLLSIGAGDITPHPKQPSLFSKENKRARVISATDAANNKWGERMIEPLATVGVSLRRHISGFHHATSVNLRRRTR